MKEIKTEENKDIEICSCCGTILTLEDECYGDFLNNEAPLCSHCSVFNEETNMYEKFVNLDVIEKITGLTFSSNIENIYSIIKKFNEYIKENNFKFSSSESKDTNMTTLLCFLEANNLGICNVCNKIELLDNLVFDCDNIYDLEYQNFRFLNSTMIPTDAVCKSCINKVGKLFRRNLRFIKRRQNENGLVFRVGDYVLLENVNWQNKNINANNHICEISSINEDKKTYTVKEYGDVEFKESEFFDVVNEAYVNEYADFISANYPNISDAVDEWSYPNWEGHPTIEMAFENFGYIKEFVLHLKSCYLPYDKLLEPKVKTVYSTTKLKFKSSEEVMDYMDKANIEDYTLDLEYDTYIAETTNSTIKDKIFKAALKVESKDNLLSGDCWVEIQLEEYPDGIFIQFESKELFNGEYSNEVFCVYCYKNRVANGNTETDYSDTLIYFEFHKKDFENVI